MRMHDGEDYILLKDAGAMSGYSLVELQVLCLEGKVRSKWLSDGSCFVGKRSLLQYMKKGDVRVSLHGDLRRGLHGWHERMSKKFNVLIVTAVVFVVVLILPLFFLGGTMSMSQYDASLGASAFNSMTPLQENSGNLFVATVSGVNDRLAGGIEQTIMTVYRIFMSVF